jgi:hypothetical protein
MRGGQDPFRGVNLAERIDNRSIARGNTRPKEVGNCEGRDIQNDPHDDPQFEEGKAILLLPSENVQAKQIASHQSVG